MREAVYRLTGFDLTTIDGIGVDTAAVVVSELGPDFSAFPDEGHFVAYLRLAPKICLT
jgi:transposase